MKRYILLALIIIWMIIIFILSSKSSVDSLNDSNFITDIIIGFLEKIFDKEFNVDIIDYIVRKCAHLFEYFVLGILVVLYLNTFNIDVKKQICISILFCVFYSLTDEFHQLFIPGRSGKILDVFVDLIGSIFGILIVKKNKKIN